MGVRCREECAPLFSSPRVAATLSCSIMCSQCGPARSRGSAMQVLRDEREVQMTVPITPHTNDS
jgi:hypothetical protein